MLQGLRLPHADGLLATGTQTTARATTVLGRDLDPPDGPPGLVGTTLGYRIARIEEPGTLDGGEVLKHDGTVVGYPPLLDDPDTWQSLLDVPEEPGSHVVLLDEQTALMSTSAPRTAELFAGLGPRVVAVDLTEYEKLEGCVTCLSVRLGADH